MIEVSVPVRICDIGGWTDTWFGGPGRVLNIAVTPGVEVSIRTTVGADPVVLEVETFGDRYSIVPKATRVARHPLLEAAIDAFPPPRGTAVEVSVRSGAPAGCGTGTSAAVAVALLGGLAALRQEQPSAARHRLRGASARSRHPRRPERDPGPVERGVRRDQLPRNRDIPRSQRPPTADLAGTRSPTHTGLPWSGPRLLGHTPPGHRECGASRVRGLVAVTRCSSRGVRRCSSAGP